MLASFALQSGKLALLAATVKGFAAPIHPYLSLGDESIV